LLVWHDHDGKVFHELNKSTHRHAQPDRSSERFGLYSAVAVAVITAGCTSLPPARLAEPGIANASGPAIIKSVDGRESLTQLEVLTFNIEGLGWPARRGRASQLRRIGEVLAQHNQRGDGPDIVLVQEMFSPAAVRAITQAGYPYRAWGPSRTQRRRRPLNGRMHGPAHWNKGETGFHLVGSGLAVLSRFPIVSSHSEPFGTHHCAGFDCLSNKGVLHVRIAVPGVPQPIDIFNVHLNSRSASRVPFARSGVAHALQVDDVAQFIAVTTDRAEPVILGGDFNMRSAPQRLAPFDTALHDLTMVQRYCIVPVNSCDVRISWDGDEPWMDTEDLQIFRKGPAVSVIPLQVKAMFDGSDHSPKLSDHDGFNVKYRLMWHQP
jgi:endonuclease/exonuclease/phosphatase family metal-dependent hydrolase